MKPKQTVKGGTDLEDFDFDDYDEDEPEPDKGKQFKTIKELMHRTDVSEVVNACDVG